MKVKTRSNSILRRWKMRLTNITNKEKNTRWNLTGNFRRKKEKGRH